MKHLLFVLLSLVTIGIQAQVTEAEDKVRKASTDTIDGWKKGGVVNISVAQASFKNWAAGGQNSVSLNSLVSVFANYKKGNATWDNMLDIGYGFLQQGKDGAVLKTDDKIDFSSKYGQKASKTWYYAALLNFKTQMAPGYNYPNDSVAISRLFAPAYIVGAIGMDYKPSDNFTGFIAPLTSKTTIVADKKLSEAKAFGVDSAKTIKSEFGGYMRFIYKHNFFKDNSVSLLTKLDLFSNYLKDPQYVDVNWETIISFKVNKYISATVTTQLLYDHDIKIPELNADGSVKELKPRIQFKEVIGLGFNYKF